MPRAKVNFAKKNSGSTPGLKFFLFICIILIFQDSFLLYRNYDKARIYTKNLFASDSTNIEATGDSLFGNDDSFVPDQANIAEDNKNNEPKQTVENSNEPTNAQNAAQATPGKIVKVSILNGCGVTGLAGKWKSALRSMNYDVRETDNSKEKYPSSVILCRTDDNTSALQLASKLGIAKKNVIPQKNKNIVDIDITLVLGKDHEKLKLK